MKAIAERFSEDDKPLGLCLLETEGPQSRKTIILFLGDLIHSSKNNSTYIHLYVDDSESVSMALTLLNSNSILT